MFLPIHHPVSKHGLVSFVYQISPTVLHRRALTARLNQKQVVLALVADDESMSVILGNAILWTKDGGQCISRDIAWALYY